MSWIEESPRSVFNGIEENIITLGIIAMKKK